MTNPYVKSVRHLDEIDIYQIGNLYEVKSHAVFHALKKILCAGKRGAKDYEQDLMEAIEAIERELQIVELNAGHLPDGEGWIEWKKGSSINSDEYPFVEVKLANGQSNTGKPGSLFEWYVRGAPDDIVAYRKADDFDEQRIDVIGQNGGEPHYDDWRLKVDWKDAPDQTYRYAFQNEFKGQMLIYFSKNPPAGSTLNYICRPADK